MVASGANCFPSMHIKRSGKTVPQLVERASFPASMRSAFNGFGARATQYWRISMRFINVSPQSVNCQKNEICFLVISVSNHLSMIWIIRFGASIAAVFVQCSELRSYRSDGSFHFREHRMISEVQSSYPADRRQQSGRCQNQN